MPLQPDQSIAVVPLGVPLEAALSMLLDANLNPARHPNIKVMAPACDDVGVVDALFHARSLLPADTANENKTVNLSAVARRPNKKRLPERDRSHPK
jgi:hypothetical protein